MKLELLWLNCLWLILPLIVWNLFLGPKLNDPRITSDGNSPKGLLIAENITRMAVFALPLFIPLTLNTPLRKAGLIIYLGGTLVYFASWMPLLLAPNSTWSNSSLGLLAPRLTPLLVFLGIAMIGPSWLYGGLTILFIALHAIHGVQNLQNL